MDLKDEGMSGKVKNKQRTGTEIPTIAVETKSGFAGGTDGSSLVHRKVNHIHKLER